MSNIAVIKTGGKQYKVVEGEVITIEKLLGEENDKVTFETLLISDENGEKVEFGAPLLTKTVTGTIVKQYRERKIEVVKFKAKSRYRRRQGHRQHKSDVKIDKI